MINQNGYRMNNISITSETISIVADNHNKQVKMIALYMPLQIASFVVDR